MGSTGRRNQSCLQIEGKVVTKADTHVYVSKPNENGQKIKRGDKEEDRRDGEEAQPDRKEKRSRVEKTGGQIKCCTDQ